MGKNPLLKLCFYTWSLNNADFSGVKKEPKSTSDKLCPENAKRLQAQKLKCNCVEIQGKQPGETK